MPAFVPVPHKFACFGHQLPVNTPAAPPSHLLRGALFIIGSELMFSLMGASIRVLSHELDNTMIVFARNLVGLGLLLALTASSGVRHLATAVPHLHLLRGAAGLGAMYCFFYAIANMPLANAMLLKLTAPLFIPLVALAWLGERFNWQVPAALAVGFSGVALILVPDFAQMAPVAVIALLGGVLAAVAKVTVRRLARTEPTTRTVFYFAAIGSAISAIPLIWTWQTPSPAMLAWILALGVLATSGQLLLTRGMACAPAARLGPFAFFSVVFGALLGWLFWDEVLYWSTIAGTALVLVSGIIVGGARRRTGDTRALAVRESGGL